MKTRLILATLAALSSALVAADIKVSALPTAGEFAGTELLMLVQDATSKKTTVGDVSDYTIGEATGVFQAADTKLGAIAGLANGPGALVNNGSGTFSYVETTTGGNGSGDVGKIPVFGTGGSLIAQSYIRTTNGTSYTGIVTNGLTGYKNGQFVSINWPSTPTSARSFTFPDATGTIHINGQALGTPASATLTNATGLPVATGISGLGTGIAAALAINTGSAGAPVLYNGAGGTPSAITLTNGTGLPPSGVTGTAAILGANTFTGAQTITANGAASTPPLLLSGTTYTGGTSTTNMSTVLVQPSGATARTAWDTNGTAYGANMPTGFTGAFADFGIGNERYFYCTPTVMILQASQVRLVSGSQLWFGSTGTVDTSIRRINTGVVSVMNSGANELRVSGNSGGSRYAVLSNDGTDSILNNVGGGKLRIVGSATNDTASTGDVGEAVASTVAVGSAVALTTNTPANVTSVTLTAGDWDVSGVVNLAFGSATHTGSAASFSTTTATLATDGSEGYNGEQITITSTTGSVPVGLGRVSLSATTTVYLVARSTFSAGTVGAFGKIVARRRR